MENHAEERTVNLKFAVVMNEAQLPEPVHEKVNASARCAHHFRKDFLTNFGHFNFFGHALFAETSKQKKNTGKPFLAGVKKLVNQVFLVPDVPRQ
jgi:hypothetical protein